MSAAPSCVPADSLPDLHQLADLEPLSTGDLIDRAVFIYRANFAPLLGLSILPVLTSCAGALLVAYTATGLRESVATLPVQIVGFVVGYFLTYFVSPLLLVLITGGLTRTVADFIMLDVPISFRRTWRMARGRLWPLIWSQLIGAMLFWLGVSGVALVGLFILWVIVLATVLLFGYLTTVLAGGFYFLLTGFVIALGFVGYCAVLAQVALLPSVVMIEGRSVWDSVVRAMQLARGTILRIAQITLFDIAIASSVISALGIPLLVYVLLNGEFDDLTRTPMWFLLSFSVADQLGKLVTLPMATIAYCLLYFDVRVRHEGYDVELLGARLESAATRLAATAPRDRRTPEAAAPSPTGAAL
ncbi:MAG: hypothetical protein NZ585_02520 [Chloracidobacterium sp.]|nr:hypothetical protein [Chloracidobacterium sp.]MDW8218743.1 hypothetical protein [Acidobacteriota bacterium]